jgi:LEA14-like dessication related protein
VELKLFRTFISILVNKMNDILKFKLVVPFALVLLLSGCFTLPSYNGVSNFKLKNFKDNTVDFSMQAKFFNPNGYGIRVRPSTFDLYINNDFIGKAKLNKAFKMKRKSETDCFVPISLQLEKGKMVRLLALANVRSGVDIRLDGVLKASALGIPKREKIDKSKHVNLRDLNLNFGGVF